MEEQAEPEVGGDKRPSMHLDVENFKGDTGTSRLEPTLQNLSKKDIRSLKNSSEMFSNNSR